MGRSAYLDDLLATNAMMMERDIAHARERLSGTTDGTDVPPILRCLSPEEWGLVRSIIEETLEKSGRLTESMKIPLLYLAAESWNTVFWVIEHAWHDEWEMEEVLSRSYRLAVETAVLQMLPCMLPPNRLQELTKKYEQTRTNVHDIGELFHTIQRIREEAQKRAEAIRRWCCAHGE